MFLFLTQEIDYYFQKAVREFDESFLDKFKSKPTYKESIASRYIIQGYNYPYHCISHKSWIIFIGFGDNKIWVDIEVLKSREEGLLDYFGDGEYRQFGWKWWRNFYLLWSVKESLVKKKNLEKLEDWLGFEVVDIDEVDEEISWVRFGYRGKIGGCEFLSGVEGELVYSVVR